MRGRLKRAAMAAGRVILLALFLLAVVLPIYWMAITLPPLLSAAAAALATGNVS